MFVLKKVRKIPRIEFLKSDSKNGVKSCNVQQGYFLRFKYGKEPILY